MNKYVTEYNGSLILKITQAIPARLFCLNASSMTMYTIKTERQTLCNKNREYAVVK